MILSLFTATVIYVIGVYIMLNVLNPEEFYASLTPVADAGEKFLSWLPGSWGVTAVVVLVFDVEAVAKLASAFQLLLFGIMSLSVIVMRESKIDGYSPGFRSPLYPWVQIVGMIIPVWLIAEMGF